MYLVFCFVCATDYFHILHLCVSLICFVSMCLFCFRCVGFQYVLLLWSSVVSGVVRLLRGGDSCVSLIVSVACVLFVGLCLVCVCFLRFGCACFF